MDWKKTGVLFGLSFVLLIFAYHFYILGDFYTSLDQLSESCKYKKIKTAEEYFKKTDILHRSLKKRGFSFCFTKDYDVYKKYYWYITRNYKQVIEEKAIHGLEFYIQGNAQFRLAEKKRMDRKVCKKISTCYKKAMQISKEFSFVNAWNYDLLRHTRIQKIQEKKKRKQKEKKQKNKKKKKRKKRRKRIEQEKISQRLSYRRRG